MERIVFIDMHCVNFLVRPYHQIKAKNRLMTYKHKFILDYALENNIVICNYISGEDTTIPKLHRMLKYDKNKRISVWEHDYVMKNSFDKELDVVPILGSRDIKDDDIVVGYFHKSIQRRIIKGLPGHKIMMGNHFVEINEPVDLDELGIEGLVNEIDLSDNQFLNKYIKFSGKFIVCPYIYTERFVEQNRERKNKMLAIGTLSTCKGHSGYKLYREMFHTEWIQPMRKEILDKALQYPKYMDSYISYINEDKIKINDTDNIVIKIVKKFINKFKPWRQSKYMSFNMVDKFNEYLCFACPEELVGMPGIGFVEGMACGTAYIGLETDYYKKLGLIPGLHYIIYDGSFQDLLKKIQDCQNNAEQTRTIGINGRNYVRENFDSRVIVTRFFQELEDIISEGSRIHG